MLATFDSTTPGPERASSDDEVMQAVVAWRDEGDQAAARRIVALVSPLVRSVAYQMLPRAWMAEDAVQDTLAGLFKSLDRFDARIPLGAWAVHLARNACSNLLRSWHRRAIALPVEADARSLSDAEDGAGRPTLDEKIMAREELRMVLHLIGRLGATDRLIVNMLLMGDCSAEDAGRATGLSAGAARARACRIRAGLREGLEAARR